MNKQKKEERIDSTLLTLQREFGRIEILQDIYSSDLMKGYIAEAYKLGIEFAREATLYYSRPTYRRVLEAVTKPPQLGIDTKISAITAAMTEIEKESRTLNSQRLHYVQQRVDEVQREVHSIKTNTEGRQNLLNTLPLVEVLTGALASQVHEDRRMLGILKSQLLPDSHDPNDTLSRYSSEVRQSFRNPGRLNLLNVDQLMQEPIFKQWENSRKSSMMLLQGRTAITPPDYSWLSPVTFRLIDLYRTQNCLVIFHCCHDRVFMERDTPAHVVVSSLVYQVLDAQSSVLRDQQRFEELKRKLSDRSWSASSATAAFAVLSELLESFSKVYILLDRVDRVKGDPDKFLEPLVNLVKWSKCTIKVFLTASSNQQSLPEGKLTPDLLESIDEQLGSQGFSMLTMNQK